MRSYWAPLAFIGLSLAAHGLSGQSPPPPLQAPSPYPMAATILVNQADVFSAPGFNTPGNTAYPTSRLPYGSRVVLRGESNQPGVYVILPPPGSFSWIDAKYVKAVPGMDRIGIVDAGDPQATAPILPGSNVVNKEPNGVIARVATGTQLVLLDRRTSPSAGGPSYFPIAPVSTEVRFLPIDAVRNGGGGYASNTTGYGGQTIPTSWQTPANSANSQFPFIDLANQGKQALEAGNFDRARSFYAEAISLTNDPAWRTYLTNQLAKISASGASQSVPFQSGSSPAGVNTWNPTSAAPLAPPAASPGKKWSPYGFLRGTGISTSDGQPMYLLEDPQTRGPLMYVTTQKGNSLQSIVGQFVTIFGALVPRNDGNINMSLLVAEHYSVQPAPTK